MLEAGGDGIINTEDEVRPVLVTDTQYAVRCFGRDRETGWSIPHLTISSEEGPGAGGHKSFVLVSRPLVYLNVLNQANHKADAHISKISLNKSKVFQAPTDRQKLNYTTEYLSLRHSKFVPN